MFYSHNLLAKKGPLGTVWCAAHLQGRLKKTNYINVHIPSTVEKIMNPEVPIALRMSGYLLFGVVRIYSKKVEYLQHDCNVLRIDISKAYANADINLPEDANQAKYESITLPDNFALDLMSIDDHDLTGSPDSHLRRNEDISFTDHSPASFSKNRQETPAGYIVISVGEGASRSPSILRNSPGPSSTHVDEIPHPQTPPSTIDGVQDPGPDVNEDEVAPPETLRIVSPSFQKSPLGSFVLPDRVEPDEALVNEIEFNHNNNNNNNDDFSNINDIADNGGPSSPPKQISPQESMHSEHDHVQDSVGPHVSFELAPSSSRGKRPAELAPSSPRGKRPAELAPSSLRGKRPAEPAPSPPRVKRRRIKYDQATVLTNEFMKKSIDDASGIKRKRKGVSSFLDVYRINNAHKKEKVLFDPVITGLCDNLSELFEDDNVSSKAQLINIEQANPDAMELGRFSPSIDRNDNMIPPISSPDNTIFSSPRPGDQDTPAFGTDIGSKSYQAATVGTSVGATSVGTSVGATSVGTSVGATSVGTTPNPASSIGSFMSDIETPFPQSHHGFDNSGGLYDIPEVDDAEEFAFIEVDGDAPSLRGTPEPGSLLPRTRGVAQLIKDKSAATPSTSESLGSVSMNSILEGKTRKICSRMFFETLVLKSCDLIDVKQDEPYGDITLKVTPMLSKLDFSN